MKFHTGKLDLQACPELFPVTQLITVPLQGSVLWDVTTFGEPSFEVGSLSMLNSPEIYCTAISDMKETGPEDTTVLALMSCLISTTSSTHDDVPTDPYIFNISEESHTITHSDNWW